MPNFHRDGAPESGQVWCSAALSPDGKTFGIVVGCGDLRITFIPETHVEAFLLEAVRTAETPDDLANVRMVEAAAQTLPRFKQLHKAVDAAGKN